MGGRGPVRPVDLIQLIPPVATLAALLSLTMTGALTPLTAAATYVLAGLRSWPGCRRRFRGARTGRARHTAAPPAAAVAALGVRSYGVDLCGVLALYVDQALVVGLLKPDVDGLYVVALSLARVINAIQGSVALLAFPTLVGLEPRQLRAAIARSARLSALFSAALGLGVVSPAGR